MSAKCSWRVAAVMVALLRAAPLMGAPSDGASFESSAPSRPRVAPLVVHAAQAALPPPSSDTALEARTREVSAALRCPVCQGNSIEDSPSELAQQMKALVRDQLRAGKTPDDVKRYFVDKYGEWILLEPKATGFNLLVYVLPIIGVAAGGFVIWRAVKKWTAAPPAAGAG